MGRNSGPAATLATLQDDRNAGHRMNAAPGSDAVELWATCPRVKVKEPGLRKPRSVAKHWESKMEIAVFVCLIVLLTALPVFFLMR